MLSAKVAHQMDAYRKIIIQYELKDKYRNNVWGPNGSACEKNFQLLDHDF